LDAARKSSTGTSPRLFSSARQPNGTLKREFLDFVLSNSFWKDGELTVTYRTSFNIIAEMTTEQARKKAAGDVSNGLSPVQRGGRDAFRTLCLSPSEEAKDVFEQIGAG
jgi:hypothetical protein